MEVVKKNVGIDISKDDFVATTVTLMSNQEIIYHGSKKFKNNPEGFKKFYLWVNSIFDDDDLPVHFTMEPTGVYYESLAYYLFEKEQIVHVVLPNKAKKFAESLNIKSKTDKLDSKALGRMGAERKLDRWVLSSKIYRKLKILTREREMLQKDKTRTQNQLHAENHSAEPIKRTINRMKNRTKYLEKQIKAVEKDIRELIENDEFVSQKVKKITTIPGIGLLTAAVIIAETNGFCSIKNQKQLTSYAGYDIILKESGKWKGKSKISKKGNSHIRRALYMPSLSSINHTETYKNIYTNLNEYKQNGLIAGTAIQRKLLCLIYTLWKNDTCYIENYQQMKRSKDVTSGNDETKSSFCAFAKQKKVGEKLPLNKIDFGLTNQLKPSFCALQN